MTTLPRDGAVGALLAAGFDLLKRAGIPSPRLDAELLLGAVLGLSRLNLVLYPERPVSEAEFCTYEAFLERRVRRESVAYILGEKEFWGLRFEVSPAVLVPRPETELIVEEGLRILAAAAVRTLRVLDLGTGSGCIAVSLGASFKTPKLQMVAVDVSSTALAVAQRNAQAHKVDIDFRLGSWWQALKPGETFDLIVSNPPYIPRGSTAVDPELETEPVGALYAEDEGLADIMTIVEGLPQFLVPGGVALVEIGFGQASQLRDRGVEAHFLKDLAGIERIMVLKNP